MTDREVRELLEEYRRGSLPLDQAVERFRELPLKELQDLCLDNHRSLRVGYPEVIYCSGKSDQQLRDIFSYYLRGESNILGTRADERQYQLLQELSREIEYRPKSRTLRLQKAPIEEVEGSYVAVVSAGGSDLPVAEEAADCLEFFGSSVLRIYDVGVAGIHRLFRRLEEIRAAKAVIAVAGMEGALASVLAGLIDSPLIAVPSSVGYGASFHGVAALLAMLNSCASGVSVVNIDNGFGAAYQADMINRL